MRTTWLPDVEPRPRRVAVGEFDGVHLGHQAVIGDADTVLTFEPHPRVVLTPDAAPKLLTALPVKADLIAGLRVRELVVVPFDDAFAALEPQAFIQDILIDRLNATEVRVGDNFRFGYRARGDVELLQAQTAFTTHAASLVSQDGAVISSTRIRQMITEGDIEQARRSLGMPFQLRGTVEHGEERGRTIGYPTANLVPDEKLCYPAFGVYACRAALPRDDGTWDSWPAAVSIGVRPTFETKLGTLVEAYLIGYEGDCYGRELRLAFLDRLRGEEHFDSVDDLLVQMRDDVDRTVAIAG